MDSLGLGWSIGAFQWLVTKRYLHVDLQRWREVSALGGLLASIVALHVCQGTCANDDSMYLWVNPSLRPADGLLLSMLLFLGLFSTAQFLMLRRQARAAPLWIIAHVISVPLVYALWKNPLAYHFPRVDSTTGLVLAIPLVVALVTGAVMLRIVLVSANGVKAKREAMAYQAATRTPPEFRSPSVGDA